MSGSCRTCDGTGYIETAAPDSRVIHHEPCPDCAAPRTAEHEAGRRLWKTLHAALGVEGHVDHWWQFGWDELPGELQGELADAALRQGQAERDALVQALVEEYAACRAQDEPWQWMPAAEPSQRDYLLGARHALERVAARLGVTDLYGQARRLSCATIEPALDPGRGDGQR